MEPLPLQSIISTHRCYDQHFHAKNRGEEGAQKPFLSESNIISFCWHVAYVMWDKVNSQLPVHRYCSVQLETENSAQISLDKPATVKIKLLSPIT